MKKRLLVEGRNDLHVVKILCEKFNVLENFEIKDCNGIDGVFETIPQQLRESEIDTIGIIVDADTNFLARWEKIRNILTPNGLSIENNFPEDGLIPNTSPKIGVWIMPNNKDQGKLENFFEQLIPEKDNVIMEVEATLKKIENQNISRYSGKDRPKAKIHTWLAWQKNPGMPMGFNIKNNEYLSTDNETCQKFVCWLTELFK
jgi:hypothetical protein